MKYRIINLLINVLITLLLLGIGYLIFQNFDSVKNFTLNKIYYPVINPKAGAEAYEKEYKTISDKAEKLRLKNNKLVDETQKKLMDLKVQSMADFNGNYEIQLQDIFNERDQYLRELIEIDNKAIKLHLPSEFKEFYDKRSEADMNEYDAFKDYRQGSETLSKGMILYEFGELYTPIMDLLVDKDRLNKDTIDQLKVNLSQFEAFYRAKITPLIFEEFFTDEISKDLEDKLKTMRVITNFQVARLSEDDENARKYYQEIENISAEGPNPKSPTEMFLDWSNERVQPLFYFQNKKHTKSYTMFNEAYKYAKIKNLKEIITVWDGKYPGSTEFTPNQPSYKL